jgi:glutamate carboxypeptidase
VSGAPVRRLHTWLEDRVAEMAALLERMVAVESPSTDPATMPPLLDLVEEEFAALGFTSRRVPGVRTGGWTVAHRAADDAAGAPQLLVGHLDTVWPVGTIATRPPPRAVDGVLRGPGAYDMKAGIVQLLFALRAIDALGMATSVPPVVLCTTDEEIGSRESTPAVVALARRADRAFVLEPSLGPTGRVKTARKGVGRFTVTVRGRAAHAGLEPGAGASAILELAHVIQALFALNDPAAGVTVNVGTIDGGLRPNVVAPVSSATADVRVATHADAARVEAAFEALAPTTPGTTLTIEGGFGRPPMERTEGTARLWELVAAAATELGLDLEEGLAGGGSDGNTTAALTPTLDGLGAVGGGAHAEDEHVLLDRLAERAALLGALLVAGPVGGRSLPPGAGLTALVDALPTPAETGPVTAAEAIRSLGVGVGAGVGGRGEETS